MDMGDEQGLMGLGEDSSYSRSKREYDDDDDGNDSYDERPKRPRHADKDNDDGKPMELRLLIASKVAGSIIGKGGENVKRLRSKYSASITIPDSPSPERLVVIRADMECILDILYEIIPCMDEDKKGRSDPDYRGDVRFLVHKNYAGSIIGRQGAQIKKLREETDTNVKMCQDCLPMSTDRLVQVVGTADKIVDAVRTIFKLIEKAEPTHSPGFSNPYNPENWDEFSVGNYGGYHADDRRRGGGGGRRDDRGFGGRSSGGFSGGGFSSGGFSGGGFSGGRNQSWGSGDSRSGGSRFRSGGGGGSSSFRGSSFGSGFSSGSDSFTQGYNIPSMLGSLSGGRKSSGGGIGGGGFMGESLADTVGDIFDSKTTTQVTIPNDLAGAIIGKGGENIKKVRQKSGTMIDIDKAQPDQDERIITIVGRPNEIQYAQFLLQQSVRNGKI